MDKVKILVVDDESRMRKLVRDFLTRQNYEVLEAADERLGSLQGNPSDIQSPDHHAHGQK